MSKTKSAFSCTECGAVSPQWNGQCSDCEAWNTIIEVIGCLSPKENSISNPRFRGYASIDERAVIPLADVPFEDQNRIYSGLSELDRVLGGGLVSGSVVLMGGDPGIGKSTVLLQTLAHLTTEYKTLYVTGEESLQQVKLRAHRLGIEQEGLRLLAETHVERILQIASQEKPHIMVIDSIQTIYTELLQSSPGSVSQVRESAAQLVRYAKQTNTALFLVGHVTKEGTLAGPRVLEHMVDTVLYFEGEADSRYRVIRAVKNRFGAVNELGIFAMTDRGLKGVSNPSAIFLSRFEKEVSGSVVMATWEGSRPMLVEVQALVDESHLGNPRRVTVGLEQNRLALGLAVLHRHGGIITYNQDVFVNIVGGVRVYETAADLPVLLAVLSSLKDKPLPNDLIVFGEVGLAGEIRPVQSGQERIKEAAKHGFKRAIVPLGNVPKGIIEGMDVVGVTSLREALEAI
jgi:DNA repair protein RadA/Sms